MTDFVPTAAAKAGDTPTHRARNCAWSGYRWARAWAPSEIAESWHLLAKKMDAECARIDAAAVPAAATQIEQNDTLDELIAKSADAYNAMAPEQRAEMHIAQAASWARAEAGFGSDADEAAYQDAFRRGDGEALARLNAGSAARVKALQSITSGKDKT